MTDRDESERLTYADVLNAEEHSRDHLDTRHLTEVSLTLALQSALGDGVSSFGLFPLPEPWAKPVDRTEILRTVERCLPEFGFVLLDVHPEASRPSRVYLVPGVDLARLAKLTERLGGAPFLYCGPETNGVLVVPGEDGTRVGDATPTPDGIVRLTSRVANAPVSFVYPPQSSAEVMTRKAHDASKPGPPFDDLDTVINSDEPARALALVLKGLAPERVRQFVERVVLRAAPLASGYVPSSTEPVLIHLDAPAEVERLSEGSGRFVAFRFTEGMEKEYGDIRVRSEFDLLDEDARDSVRRGATDLQIVDEANGLTVLVECQKAYFQTPDRLRRNLIALFEEETNPALVSVDATFGEVLAALTEIADKCRDAAEVYVVRRFGNYLRAAGLVTGA
ncbi:hypothetical protein [Rubrivirga sp. IMCC45206]|uniref:hypothetical protein n=1 Tax=Rubrivirga sp. IMCC45206 TaxID=3391614 RepID=UPI0039902AED